MRLNTAEGAIQAYNEKLAESVAEAFRTLLEEKHLLVKKKTGVVHVGRGPNDA